MNQAVEFLYLSQEQVIAVGLDMAEVIEIIQEVFVLNQKAEVLLPDKVVLDLGEREKGRINAMPAYVGGGLNVCGIKWIPGFPKNPQRYGLPRANALIVLNDPDNGMPLAVMDGTWISAMRTGAVTGVGAKFLAAASAETMGMIGCGVQSITQILAVSTVVPLKLVRLFDPKPEAAAKVRSLISEQTDLQVMICASPPEAVEGADVVVTATVADEPIVKRPWLKAGVLFAHVGSYQEEEYEAVECMDKIVVDDWHQVIHRGTPVLAKMYREGRISDQHIHGNLGEIVTGLKNGRERGSERIFFLPMGMGSEDVAVAQRVYQRAKAAGLGARLKLWDSPRYV